MGALAGVVQMGMAIKSGEDEGRIRKEEEKLNLSMAADAANDAVRRGNTEAGQTRAQGSKLIGQQKVAFANSGVDATVGTPADVMADTRVMSELDAKTQENNALREALGFKRYGTKYQQQAALDATRSANRTAGSVLGGVGQVADSLGKANWGS